MCRLQNLEVASFYHYSGVFKNSLRGAKYFGSRQALLQLCHEIPPSHLSAALPTRKELWIFVPVPLHKKRYRERGFNQALVIAQSIGKATSVPVVECVERTRHTVQQARLTRRERIKNLNGAFRITTEISGKDIIIVDDVWTTGSTIREVEKVCIQAGAKRVIALTLAR